MTIQKDNIRLTKHGYDRLVEHEIIQPNTPTNSIIDIIWNYMIQSKEIVTKSTIYYQYKETEFRFYLDGGLATHIKQI